MKQNPNLTPLEQEIMAILWQYRSCCIRGVVTHLSKSRKLAYTSVATMLSRLYEKGILDRQEKAGVWYYSSKIELKDYSKQLAQSFLESYLKTFGKWGVVSFAESIDTLPPETKESLLQLLNYHDKKS